MATVQDSTGRRGDGPSGAMGRSVSGTSARPSCGSRAGSSSAPSMLFQALPPKNPQEVRPTQSRVVLNEARPYILGPLLPSITSVPQRLLQEGERWRRPALLPLCLEQPPPDTPALPPERPSVSWAPGHPQGRSGGAILHSWPGGWQGPRPRRPCSP